MYEFHGWAVLDVSPGSYDDRKEREIADVVRRRIDSKVDELHCAGVKGGNLLTSVWFHGQRNHFRTGPLDFLRFIGQMAPGAYGVLFVRHTEEADTFEEMNSFKVWRLARGNVEEFSDPFLSPCVPTIEDSGKKSFLGPT